MFFKGHERTIEAKKNIILSLGFKVISVIISFIMVPLTVNYINSERYGVWLTLSSIVTMMVLFDIGLGNGLRNKFAEAKAKGELGTAKMYVSSTYAVIMLIVVALILLFSVINPFLDWNRILNISPERSEGLSRLVWITFLSFCFLFVLRLLTNIINADQKPAKAALIDLTGQLLSLFGIFFLLKTSEEDSFVNFGWVMGFFPVLVYLIASIILFNTRYKFVRPSFRFVDFKMAKGMMNLGLKFFITTVSALVMFQTTNILLSHINPEEVTNYNNANKVFGLAYNIMVVAVFPYWSAFTDAYTLKDYGWMQDAVKKLKIMFCLFVLILSLLLPASPWIYEYWLKGVDNVYIPVSMSLTVFLYNCSLCWLCIFIYPINGIGKIRVQLYSAIFEMLLIIPVALFLREYWGVNGVILAPVIVSIPRMIWAPAQLNKLVKNKARGIWNK